MNTVQNMVFDPAQQGLYSGATSEIISCKSSVHTDIYLPTIVGSCCRLVSPYCAVHEFVYKLSTKKTDLT